METISIYARYVIEDGTQVGYKLGGAKVKGDVEADLHEKYGVDHADAAYQRIEVVTNDPAIRDLASRVDWEFLYDSGSSAIGMVIDVGNKDADKLIKILWLHITHATGMFDAADMVEKHICIIYGSVTEAVRAWARLYSVPSEAMSLIDDDDVMHNYYNASQMLADGRIINLNW